jgi:hypothetical protein
MAMAMDMTGDGFSSGLFSSTFNGPYRAALSATHLVFFFLLSIWAKDLSKMGYNPFNPTMGWRMSGGSTHYTTAVGYFPNWLQGFSTWVQVWPNYIKELERLGGCPALRQAMTALQDTITTLVYTGDDQEYQWLVAAHVILTRVHHFCTSLNPEVLGVSLTLEEERQAMARVRAVTVMGNGARAPSSSPYRDHFTYPRHDNIMSRKKPRYEPRDFRPNGGRGGGGRGGGGCPIHPGTGHTALQCRQGGGLNRPQPLNAPNANGAERTG